MPASTPVHLILPFAASLSEPCQHALQQLDQAGRLPHLRRLLGRLRAGTPVGVDEYALSMPHERVWADQLGWQALADGCLPWAAWQARQAGVDIGDRPWGMLTPCHWMMGRDSLTVLNPAELMLSESESRTLLEAIRPWFEEEGWQLHYGAPTCWYASHASLVDLPTASLDRVIGRNPDVWLPDHPNARMIKRLQNEVQMLMYQHPLNDERTARGQWPVNSFWLSGCGALPAHTPLTTPNTIQVIDTLRTPLLSTNMADWLEAWTQLDATVLASACIAMDADTPVTLTLCGERHAVTWQPAAPTGAATRIAQAVKHWLGRSAGLKPSTVLATL